MKRRIMNAAVPALLAFAPSAGAQEAGPSDPGATLELPTLTVEGAADIGLVPITSSVATKTETPIELIPQSVSVVTQESLTQRRPQSVIPV